MCFDVRGGVSGTINCSYFRDPMGEMAFPRIPILLADSSSFFLYFYNELQGDTQDDLFYRLFFVEMSVYANDLLCASKEIFSNEKN